MAIMLAGIKRADEADISYISSSRDKLINRNRLSVHRPFL